MASSVVPRCGDRAAHLGGVCGNDPMVGRTGSPSWALQPPTRGGALDRRSRSGGGRPAARPPPGRGPGEMAWASRPLARPRASSMVSRPRSIRSRSAGSPRGAGGKGQPAAQLGIKGRFEVEVNREVQQRTRGADQQPPRPRSFRRSGSRRSSGGFQIGPLDVSAVHDADGEGESLAASAATSIPAGVAHRIEVQGVDRVCAGTAVLQAWPSPSKYVATKEAQVGRSLLQGVHSPLDGLALVGTEPQGDRARRPEPSSHLTP